jgi:hypothetical protein
VLTKWRLEMIVRFLDINGFVENHSLNLLFIKWEYLNVAWPCINVWNTSGMITILYPAIDMCEVKYIGNSITALLDYLRFSGWCFIGFVDHSPSFGHCIVLYFSIYGYLFGIFKLFSRSQWKPSY